MRTPLYEINRSLGARFTDFHGWEMPLQFSGVIEEVKAVRERAGLFDISHMGRLEVRGGGAFDLLQRLTTNNVGRLTPGKVQYTLFTNERGGVLDDATVYMIDEDRFFICVNAVNRERILRWLTENSERGVEVDDLSYRLVQIALQGPGSVEILREYYDLGDLRYYRFKIFGDTIISRTGYTGSDGFEIYAPADEGIALYKELLKASVPCGLGARDVLRIEAGFPLYGNELSEDITPLEAGLDKFVDLSKEFVGSEVLRNSRPRRRLTGLVMVDKGIPRRGYKIFKGDRVVGEVSSGTFSPTIGRGIALIFVEGGSVSESDEAYVDVRGKRLRGKLTSPPFFKKK